MTIKKWLVIVAISAAILVMMNLFTEALYVGSDSITLEFQVFDARIGRPIEGASIELLEHLPEQRATTDQDGVAKVVDRFMIAGRSSLFRRTRGVAYSRLLRISAEGYQSMADDLQRYTRHPLYHSSVNPPRIMILLEPMPTNL